MRPIWREGPRGGGTGATAATGGSIGARAGADGAVPGRCGDAERTMGSRGRAGCGAAGCSRAVAGGGRGRAIGAAATGGRADGAVDGACSAGGTADSREREAGGNGSALCNGTEGASGSRRGSALPTAGEAGDVRSTGGCGDTGRIGKASCRGGCGAGDDGDDACVRCGGATLRPDPGAGSPDSVSSARPAGPVSAGRGDGVTLAVGDACRPTDRIASLCRYPGMARSFRHGRRDRVRSRPRRHVGACDRAPGFRAGSSRRSRPADGPRPSGPVLPAGSP